MAGAIKVKTMALFAAEGRTLVMVCFDKAKQQRFHRLLGGHVEFGETSEEALKREMREELGTEVGILSLLQVMQNRFLFEGRPHHEVVFIHHVRFLDENLQPARGSVQPRAASRRAFHLDSARRSDGRLGATLSGCGLSAPVRGDRWLAHRIAASPLTRQLRCRPLPKTPSLSLAIKAREWERADSRRRFALFAER